MYKCFLSLCLLFIFAGALAQPGVKNKKAVKYAKTITAKDLSKHLYIVAGKEMEGRETGTEGQRRAATYIENHFKGLKLAPGTPNGYQLYYPVEQDSLVGAAIRCNGQVFEMHSDFQAAAAQNQNGTVTEKEVVFAGYGIASEKYNDYEGIDVSNKIVMIMEGEPKLNDSTFLITNNKRRSEWNGLNRKIQAAIDKGAKALLVINKNFPRKAPSTNARGRMYVNFEKDKKNVNMFYISEKIAETIVGKAEYSAAKEKMGAAKAGGKTYATDITLSYEKFNFGLQSSNVLAYLEGTDKKDELVIITAHYDHLGKKDTIIWYGADDDGSGTVSVLEIAEAFAKAKAAGHGPRRSMLFMTVSGEEKGLWGSEYYVKNPVYPLANTVADLNIDMIGRSDKEKHKDSLNYIYLIGDDKLSSDMRPISEAANNNYTKLELDYRFNDPNDPNRFYYRSDHYNFAQYKIPIIFYFNGVHADYHRPSDTPDKINYALMAKRAQLVFYTAWEIANREERLKVDRNER
jgi:Zn-dependent M28 family amino/carboxypeptidase